MGMHFPSEHFPLAPSMETPIETLSGGAAAASALARQPRLPRHGLRAEAPASPMGGHWIRARGEGQDDMVQGPQSLAAHLSQRQRAQRAQRQVAPPRWRSRSLQRRWRHPRLRSHRLERLPMIRSGRLPNIGLPRRRLWKCCGIMAGNAIGTSGHSAGHTMRVESGSGGSDHLRGEGSDPFQSLV